MHTTVKSPQTAADTSELPVQIVVVYDHPVVAHAAGQMIDAFLSKLAPETDVHRDEWSFADLEHPQCASEALELAAPCDFFIIATAASDPLPRSFVAWLNTWLQTRHPIETAVILCVAAGSQAHPALTFSFEALEHSTGLTFFARSIPIPEEKLPHAVEPKSLLARLAALNLESPPEDSGLNE